ncbi:MAG: P63C domain-containing protein [Dehalococcoidia bacterium]
MVVGRARGGVARAKSLTQEERNKIARRAAAARWQQELPQAVCGSPDRPIRIGEVEIQCYVLEDGTRVLSQAGFLEALGRHRKANVRKEGEEQLPAILQGKAIRPFIPDEVVEKSRPITFHTPSGSRASGYRAELLPLVCDIYLRANDAGALPHQQRPVARQAEILVRGLAHTGIIALVDEATGFQELRAKDALARILEAFVAKEIQAWVQTFPDDYYRHLFRLRGLDYPADSVRRPQYFGHLTNDFIYKRLAPGVLDELKKVTPRTEDGRPKHRYFQRLTSNLGYP